MNEQHSPKETSMRFRVGIIEKTEPPMENAGSEWYRYTIVHEKTRIEGKRAGTFNSVTQHLDEYVEKLNSRTYWGYSSYASRKTSK
jgi:hypothetical protein